jgi:tellurite resistance protein TehA-like permease
MSNRRSELAEMTALYLIPIVSVVIVATTGGLVATVLPDPQDRLRTLITSFVFWGMAAPLSWMVMTLYFLRLTIHEPLSREVIVSALLPVGPLGLEAFW